MDTNTKYRRWGWGAVIGLIAVILIAGLVVALTMNKKPKTDAEIASGDNGNSLVVVDDGDENTNNSSANGGSNSSEGSSNTSENGSSSSSENGSSSSNNSNSGSSSSNSEEKNSHDSSANSGSNGGESANNKSEMPKTGPVDTTFAILGMAATAYLLSLNVALAKEKVRK